MFETGFDDRVDKQDEQAEQTAQSAESRSVADRISELAAELAAELITKKPDPAMKMKKGMTVEVRTPENKLIFTGRIADVEGKIMRIVSATGDEVPPTFYDTELLLKSQGQIAGGIISHGRVRGNSREFWKVEQTESRDFRENRNHFRQLISIPAKAQRANELFGAKGSGKREPLHPCTILDISGGGLRIACDAEFEEGDWLVISEAELIPKQGMFSAVCQIRRVEKGKKTRGYGCIFMDMPPKEQDALIRKIFLLQRMEKQRRQGG